LSDAKLAEETFITFNTAMDQKWRGSFHTTLEPRQKAWAALLFSLPKALRRLRLHIGAEEWNAVNLDIR
jgi:hypothetical protein